MISRREINPQATGQDAIEEWLHLTDAYNSCSKRWTWQLSRTRLRTEVVGCLLDHLVSAVEQRVWNGKSFSHTTFANPLSVRAGTKTDLVG